MLAHEKLESERNYENLTKSLQYVSLNVSEPVTQASSQKNKNDELYHYCNMVKTVLNDIDSVREFLDSSRYQRVRSGFAGLHNIEALSLKEKYGQRATELFKDHLHGDGRSISTATVVNGLADLDLCEYQQTDA